MEISGVPIGTGFSVWPVVAEEPRHELSEQFKGDEIAVEDMDDTSALTDNNTLVDHVIGKPEETAPIEDTGTIGNTEDNDTYAQIQTGREVEFLDYLCSPLSSLSEEAQVFIRNQLGETLREKVSNAQNIGVCLVSNNVR